MSKREICECGPAEAGRIEYAIPAVHLQHDGDGYLMELDMPGVGKDGVEITFNDGQLTVVGHRAEAAPAGKVVYSEAGGHSYRRVFDLDPSIDPEKIHATIEQGLLTVRLSKLEASKPRKIVVG